MNLEKELAENTTKAIEIGDKRSAERFYKQYLFYSRKILKDFDKDLQNETVFKYVEFMKGYKK